jgi:hypothetical protein
MFRSTYNNVLYLIETKATSCLPNFGNLPLNTRMVSTTAKEVGDIQIYFFSAGLLIVNVTDTGKGVGMRPN